MPSVLIPAAERPGETIRPSVGQADDFDAPADARSTPQPAGGQSHLPWRAAPASRRPRIPLLVTDANDALREKLAAAVCELNDEQDPSRRVELFHEVQCLRAMVLATARPGECVAPDRRSC